MIPVLFVYKYLCLYFILFECKLNWASFEGSLKQIIEYFRAVTSGGGGQRGHCPPSKGAVPPPVGFVVCGTI